MVIKNIFFKKTLNFIVVVLVINWNLTVSAANYEPNDTPETAKSLTSGTYQVEGNGHDWFKFRSNPGLLELRMIPDKATDVNMVLYNSRMQMVAADFASGSETILYKTSTSDTYYVEIYPTASSFSRYSLSIRIPQNTWSRTLNFGPIRDVSVAVYDIDADGEDEIFVATSKGLDSFNNEIRPAGLICLKANGDIKWSKSFPAIDGPDSQTGIIYSTTSVSTPPVFADINGDNNIDIIIGVGGDTYGETGDPSISGQPGDRGGVYALDAHGNTIWFHESRDVIGGPTNTGDGRPDGVYGAAVVFDIDQDGKKEVIYGGWDQSLWILDAETGIPKVEVHLADTIWSTPKIADINNDGQFEILISADITENSDADTSTGGIFHVISADGTQNISGFDQPVGNPDYTMLRGKFEEQTLWSSPVTADIDGDGLLEIIYGTGNYFKDSRGSYIRVWKHNGELKFTLPTIGRTFATPLVTDLDNDGDMEIIAATLEGYLYAWDHNGNLIFETQTKTYQTQTGNPIFSSPIAVDINNDGKQEIIFSQAAQLVIVNSDGVQITESDSNEYLFQMFKGSPVAKDIDGDMKIDLISGGNTISHDQGVVFRWAAPGDIRLTGLNYGKYQAHQSLTNISSFVSRFYKTVLNRNPDCYGLNYWTDNLTTGIKAGSDVARGFIFSTEFINQDLDNESYLNVLYSAFFNRNPDPAGYDLWLDILDSGTTRSDVLDGFIFSQEFNNLCLTYSILPASVN